MTSQPDPKQPLEPLGAAFQPSKRDILRPAELVGGAAIGAVFLGLVVLLTTRDLILTLIFAGITFIVVLMVLALFTMSSKKDAGEKADIELQNNQGHGGPGQDGPGKNGPGKNGPGKNGPGKNGTEPPRGDSRH